MRIIDFTTRVVNLVDIRGSGLGDVEDHQALLSCGHVGIGSGKVDRVGILDFDMMHDLWLRRLTNIQHNYAMFIGHKSVTELRIYRVRMANFFASNNRSNLWV